MLKMSASMGAVPQTDYRTMKPSTNHVIQNRQNTWFGGVFPGFTVDNVRCQMFVFKSFKTKKYEYRVTDLHHFLPNSPKHDVRGNFPGHRTQILACETLNAPRLSCFRVPRTPPCTNVPMRTHLHPFVPVCTRLHPISHVYMYNLIKK